MLGLISSQLGKPEIALNTFIVTKSVDKSFSLSLVNGLFQNTIRIAAETEEVGEGSLIDARTCKAQEL